MTHTLADSEVLFVGDILKSLKMNKNLAMSRNWGLRQIGTPVLALAGGEIGLNVKDGTINVKDGTGYTDSAGREALIKAKTFSFLYHRP